MFGLFKIFKTLVLVVSTILFFYLETDAQGYYWVAFTDKSHTAFSLENPGEFLSERAIQRRQKQNIPIDSLDLPVIQNYLNQINELGASVVHSSKWLNGATVKTEMEDFISAALQLPFVSYVQFTKPLEVPKSGNNKFEKSSGSNQEILVIDTSYYGTSVYQVGQIRAQYLHNQGHKGEGVHIAVLDAGFYKVNEYPAFDSLRAENRIFGTKDFVEPEKDFYTTHYHGMSVLSCMGGLVPGELIGTAPKASYWLLRSEDADSEYIIEEDNWVVAAEYADSVGADVINSSLGYYLFDDSTMNHTYNDMDGKTTRAAIGANIAASKGMLVFSSVGNEGNKNWKYLITPSDGENVIAVGAVGREGQPAFFTSYGPASDGAVKPNAVALGFSAFVQRTNGTFDFSNGTSFASPVLAGASACLWQANPDASAKQVKFAIEQSSHLYTEPDSLLGYGLPDMVLADNLLKALLVPGFELENNWQAYPNPFNDYLVLQNYSNKIGGTILVSIYSGTGRLLYRKQKTISKKIVLNNLANLPQGLLILKVQGNGFSETIKLSKIR